MTDLLTRLLALAELAVDEALQFEYGDPEDRYIWRELQELKPLVAAALAQPSPVGHQATAKRAIESCLAQRDEVVAAFIAKHGFQPEDAIQIEQRQPDGTSTWRIKRRLETQPKPQGPTDEEILALSQWHEVSYTLSDGRVVYPMQEGADMKDAVLSFARAVLARWGRPAIEPVPGQEGK